MKTMKLTEEEKQIIYSHRKPFHMKWVAFIGVSAPTLLLALVLPGYAFSFVLGIVMWTVSMMYFVGWMKKFGSGTK